MISDTPGRGGEGGSRKGKFLRTSFMDGPLVTVNSDREVKNLALTRARAATRGRQAQRLCFQTL